MVVKVVLSLRSDGGYNPTRELNEVRRKINGETLRNAYNKIGSKLIELYHCLYPQVREMMQKLNNAAIALYDIVNMDDIFG